MSYPHFQISAQIPVYNIVKYIKKEDWHFTSAVVYWLSVAAHEVPTLKWRIRDNEIIEHEVLDPSFAVLPEVSDVFSFCTVEFDKNWHIFQLRCQAEIDKMKSQPSFEDEEGKDNFLFMSGLPWVSFTGIQHPISMPADSIPRVTWGKTHTQGSDLMMPIAIQAHHGLVDGKDLGRFFMVCEALARDPVRLFTREKL